MMFNYVTKDEIACHDEHNAFEIAEKLMKEGYVVMLSKEEKLTIINYIWSENNADRNDVCFNSREEVEDFIFDGSDE